MPGESRVFLFFNPTWNKKKSVFFLKKCFFSKKFVYIHHQSSDWNMAILM